MPKVSIAIPVYNGGEFIAAAIQSVLCQTFSDFELVISDNGSTDDTKEICEKYAAMDTRVKYYRCPSNIGPARNFSRAFDFSTGQFFKWHAHDDILAPRFLEACVEVLDRNPEVVLCHTRVCYINRHGAPLGAYEDDLATDSCDIPERFRVLLGNSKCFELFGLMRRGCLEKMPQPVIQSYGHSDGVLLARMGLLGQFCQIPEFLFLNRDFPERGGNTYKTYREYAIRLDPSNKGKILLPRWRMGYEFFRSIWLFRLPLNERVMCLLHLTKWVSHHLPSLAANIFWALGDIFRRVKDSAWVLGRQVRRAKNT